MYSAEGTTAGARVFVWIGALLFFASLTFFLFSYTVTFGRPASATTSRASAAAVDILLFTAFALHHSVFARERVRAWVMCIVSARLERSLYVWAASLLFIAVCALWQPVRGMVWQVSDPAAWLLIATQTIGIALILRSAAILDIGELAGWRQLEPRALASEFTTRGPYGWVRHPIYTGWLLFVFGAPTMTATRFVFAFISSAYLLLAIRFEEHTLAAASHGAYEDYMRRVPWKLLPRIY
jgi:protein-S-isoprenylcysteine O-methyltransferase Ste14